MENENKVSGLKIILIISSVLIIIIGTILSIILLIKPGVEKINKSKAIVVYSKAELQTKEETIAAKYTKQLGQAGWAEEETEKNNEVYKLESYNITANTNKAKGIALGTFKICIGSAVAFVSILMGVGILILACNKKNK